MQRISKYIVWATALVMLTSWALGLNELEALAFQKDRTYRNISGLACMGVILFQWSLTLGRVVFQRSGSQWGKWIDWHLRSALILPILVLVHSISLGWGLLAVLPLTLLAAGHFGSLLEGEHSISKNLPYHIGLSVLTLLLTVVHAITVLTFN